MPNFLERYIAGDHVAVWDDLLALGPRVRHKRYYGNAAAVVAETMCRARHNVELLIQRLERMGYRFLPQEISDAGRAEAAGRLQKIGAEVASKNSRYIDWVDFGASKEGRRAVEKAADHSRVMAHKYIEKALPRPAAPLKNPQVLERPSKQTAEDLE
jgi:hypothetical protein